MTNHLFLFTITPVQSFLSQARKTRDLFAGSQILSELINAGMEAFEGEVIFPARSENATYPNRFLGKTLLATEEHGKKVQLAVTEKLTKLAKVALAKNKNGGFEDYFRQLENYFNCFWLFEEIHEGDYRTAYLNTERKLGAIKNVRVFNQTPEIGRKCSLTGQHNALFYKQGADGRSPAFINNTNDGHFANKVNRANPEFSKFITNSYPIEKQDIDYGEGLSAIAYLKRFYGRQSFPSTAQIAALNVLKEIDDSDIYKQYKQLFSNGTSYDEQLLYKENITSAYFEKHGMGTLLSDYYIFFPYSNSTLFSKKAKKDIIDNITGEFKENIPAFEKAHKKVEKLIKGKGLHLSSYYAIILFDADNMGARLNGQDYLTEENLQKLEEYHVYLSGLLGKYAKKASQYLNEDHRGKTVYAGGDDFMGFINLFTLFDTLTYLRTTFKNEVSDPLHGKYNISSGKPFTFSAGVVIAHYKHPLSDVLTKVREAEQDAKNTKEKDALSFTVLKASGEITKSVLKWKQGAAIENLEQLVDSLENDFSTKFIYSLHTELDLYKNYSFKHKDSTHATNIVSVEAKRLIARACQIKGKKEKEKAVDQLHKGLMELFNNCLLRTDEIYNFLDLLQIVDFLKRKAKI